MPGVRGDFTIDAVRGRQDELAGDEDPPASEFVVEHQADIPRVVVGVDRIAADDSGRDVSLLCRGRVTLPELAAEVAMGVAVRGDGDARAGEEEGEGEERQLHGWELRWLQQISRMVILKNCEDYNLL